MHELAICRELVAQVSRVAQSHHARRVVSVTVRVGALSGVEPRLLESAYPLVSAGTRARESKLVLEVCALRVRCLECGAQSQPQAASLRCGTCRGRSVEILSGQELLLASVELEAQGE